jgi:HEAT repeat protein
VVQALGFLREEEAAGALAALLASGESVRFEDGSNLADYAAVHLANLGPRAVKSVRVFLETETLPERRLRGIRTLSLVDLPESGALLLERAVDPQEDREVRLAAIRAAAPIAGPAAASPLKRALYSEGDPQIRETLNCVLWDYF